MENRNFRSIIKQVVLLPLTVILVIMTIMIASTVISYFDKERQMIESNVNALQISLNQFENQLEEMNNNFVQYVTNNESFSYLRYMDEETPATEYFLYQADTLDWLSTQLAFFTDMDGVFAFFSNMDLIMFRSNNNNKKEVHDFVLAELKKEDIVYNHWQVVDIDSNKYLIIFSKYLDFYWGGWIPLNDLLAEYGLSEENFLGELYVVDNNDNNTITNPLLNDYIKSNGRFSKNIKVDDIRYRNYLVSTDYNQVNFGLLIPEMSIINNIPTFNKVIFLIALLSLFLIPGIIYWLRSHIAKPLKEFDAAMKIIVEEDIGYRLKIPDKKYYDEFDHLSMKFNEMLDDIEKLGYDLYKVKINEQNTQLKYISQQIRPHFILNALNIIYTYEEKEFPLVKKMVLYLSEYFKYIVNLKVDFVEVEKEFRHIDNYLKIQKERYPKRFEYTIEADSESSKYSIPPLLIQTFVENCIKYAMKNYEKLLIEISALIIDEKLVIRIIDNGNGFDNATLIAINAFIKERSYQENLGVGIENAIERLDIMYNHDFEITIRNLDTGGGFVEIIMPSEPNLR